MAHGNAKSGIVANFSVALSGAVSVNDLVVHGMFYSDDVTTAKINDATNGDGKDNLGNTYSTLGPLDFTNDGDLLYIFYSIITNAGTPTVRFVASGGTHTFWDVWSTQTPTNTFSLDQAVTTNYATTGTSLSAGSQTPTTSKGYAYCVFADLVGVAGFVAGGGFTFRDETSDAQVVFQDLAYASNAALTPTATVTNSGEHGGVLALFKDQAAAATTVISQRSILRRRIGEYQ